MRIKYSLVAVIGSLTLLLLWLQIDFNHPTISTSLPIHQFHDKTESHDEFDTKNQTNLDAKLIDINEISSPLSNEISSPLDEAIINKLIENNEIKLSSFF